VGLTKYEDSGLSLTPNCKQKEAAPEGAALYSKHMLRASREERVALYWVRRRRMIEAIVWKAESSASPVAAYSIAPGKLFAL
jgi:hypothetical protein